MAYVPNPEDASRPIGSDPPSSLPEELRGIKTRINAVASAKADKTTYTVTSVPSGEGSPNASGNIAVNLSLGNFFRYTLTGNTTFTFTAPEVVASQIPYFTLRLINSGNFTINWPTIRWELGVVPTRTVDGTDVFVFYKPTPESTFWEGKLVMRDVQ